jgi:hypothetical protein
MEYLDKSKLQQFNQAMQDKEQSRSLARDKEYPTPAEIREAARKRREELDKQGNPWTGMK